MLTYKQDWDCSYDVDLDSLSWKTYDSYVSQTCETSKDKDEAVMRELAELRRLTMQGLEGERTKLEEERQLLTKERETIDKVCVCEPINSKYLVYLQGLVHYLSIVSTWNRKNNQRNRKQCTLAVMKHDFPS